MSIAVAISAPSEPLSRDRALTRGKRALRQNCSPSYYRARYYDPNPGRFLREDPIRFEGGVNFYPYVKNSPVQYSDPFGLLPTSEHRRMTYDLARAIFGPKCERLANFVAQENAAVDALPSGWATIKFVFGFGEGWRRPGPHFPDDATVRTQLQNAFQSCDERALGRGLHSIQDAMAHSGAYSIPRVHWFTGTLADDTAMGNSRFAPDLGFYDDIMTTTASILRAYKAKCLK